ncbi:DUF4062 domain-containing protein [Variovorax sp. V15]|uniref:DUF4062 domain-containing protein n=1 Tax=Variovorax sp. V15 TaxID=3065952 RepID=UPI0034E8591E
MSTKRRLQVFVSSTYSDLKEERQAAVAAILKAGHIPAGMELFTAGDESQMTIIKRWIDESDVYMLILGGRYGSIEKTSGLSYTELEFDYAVANSKPLFAVVMTDEALETKVKKHGRVVLELDAPAELKAFRSKVLSNISSFFEDLKDIKLSVHESLSDFASNRDLKGWVAAGDVQDTAPLFDQIERLSEQNSQLRERISYLERSISTRTDKADDFDEMYEVLRGVLISVPEDLRAEETPAEMDLFSVFWSAQDRLLTGFTNHPPMEAMEEFLYYVAGPKLMIQGLVELEKSNGAYRRMITTRAGQAFLAHNQKRMVAEAKLNNVPADATDADSPPAAQGKAKGSQGGARKGSRQ